MARGIISHLHPPMNGGTNNGVAMVSGDDGSFHVAQTPRDNNSEALYADPANPVYYILTADGNNIASLSHTNPDDDGTGGVGGTDGVG